MPDDDLKQRGPDRVKVARYQGYKPSYLARKYGLSAEAGAYPNQTHWQGSG
jgi:hypothetical protein